MEIFEVRHSLSFTTALVKPVGNVTDTTSMFYAVCDHHQWPGSRYAWSHVNKEIFIKAALKDQRLKQEKVLRDGAIILEKCRVLLWSSVWSLKKGETDKRTLIANLLLFCTSLNLSQWESHLCKMTQTITNPLACVCVCVCVCVRTHVHVSACFSAVKIAEAWSLQLHTTGDNTHPELLMEMKTTLFFPSSISNCLSSSSLSLSVFLSLHLQPFGSLTAL